MAGDQVNVAGRAQSPHPRSPIITNHAIERWVERICCEQDDAAPWDLRDAFHEALIVKDEDEEFVRFHPPTQSIMVYNRDWSSGPDVITTILYADWREIEDDHLDICQDCGLRYDPAEGSCKW